MKRRGGRLRRRRRLGFGAVAALALVLPASLMAGVLTAGFESAVELSVAGPAPMGGMAAMPATTTPIAEAGEVPAPAVEAPATTVAEVHERVAAVNGVPGARSSTPTSMPPSDDPVVRPTSTVAPPVTLARPAESPNQPTALSAPSSAASPLPPCPAQALQIDVVPSKATFSLGETATGMSFVQTGRAADCLLPVPGSFRIENVATGKEVGFSAAVTEHPCPLVAQPGKMYTSTFSWDQK
ncbi:MAG: hypothetical protein Q8K72_18965, partial [Acidimicrobiales bacterium]|nr:hypothetical protein [Acidimicrobiales bacterium]